MSVVSAPLNWVEFISALKLPPKSDQRLQILMDRNNEGTLSDDERGELESLVEMSQTLSFARAQALHLLGRDPL